MTHLLKDVFRCNFTGAVRKISSRVSRKDSWWLNYWSKRAFYFDAEGNSEDLIDAMLTCLSNRAIVVKLVSLKNLKTLAPLMKAGVKVIHLVRDARAVVNSRRQLHARNKELRSDVQKSRTSFDIVNASRRYCQEVAADLKAVSRLNLELLQNSE